MSNPVHATAFAYQGSGCLLLGPSGSGKSRIAAEALLHGAKLIGDDRVFLVPMMGLLGVTQLPELQGVLELRGLGLIKIADTVSKHILHLAIELDPECDERLPERRTREFEGMALPYLRVPAAPRTTGAMVLLYLKAMQESRVLPTDWRPQG